MFIAKQLENVGNKKEIFKLDEINDQNYRKQAL